MSARRAVVTGASGHLGFHVAKVLLQKGVATDLLIRTRNENVTELAQMGARIHAVNLGNGPEIKPFLDGADVLFHLAAENTIDTSRSASVLASTIGLTRSVLSSALEAAVPVIVYTSSVVVLGRSMNPQVLISEDDRTSNIESPYAQGKVEAEQLCKMLISSRGADIRRIYPSWVIGPNDQRGTPPHQIINRCLRKGQRFWFQGGISVASAEDVADGHVNAWLRGTSGAKYVLGGTNLTFREFFDLIAEVTGRKSPQIFLPKSVILTGASLLDGALNLFGKKSPVAPTYLKALIGSYSWYDSSRAVRELSYKIPDVKALLANSVQLERMRLAGTYSLGRARHLSAPVHSESTGELPPLLITGVPGWLGNRFIDVLINGLGSRSSASRQIHLLVEPRFVKLLQLPPRFRIFPGDLSDLEAMRVALQCVGTVIHLAGAIYPPRISTLYKVNSEGSRNLIDACISLGVRRFLYMSTDSVCGHGTREKRLFDEDTAAKPYRHYGMSKYLAEQYLFERTTEGQIDGTVLRGFWFFGPYAPSRQEEFLKMMRKPRQIVFGNGKNYRSVSHVDNIITAFLQVENAPQTIGRWYWIGDAKADYTVDELYRILCEASGSSYSPIYIPGAVCKVMRGFDSLVGRTGRLHPTIHGIGKFDFDIGGSIAAAQRDFGYEPATSLAEYAQKNLAPRGS
jgi:dihydroflavonol-4-reductase